MVHNVIRVTLILGIIASVYHFIYAHFIMGNSPMELLLSIGILTIGTLMFLMNKQDKLTKGLLGFSLLLLIIHYVYAHILKGNNPPELVIAIILVFISVAIVFTRKIDFKK